MKPIDYQPQLDVYLEVSDKAFDWRAKRYELIMAGQMGKAIFIEKHILPTLESKEKQELYKLNGIFKEMGYE